METSACDWIDFGNLAIGIGTFALAMVLGIISVISTKKARKIHIADKRQEWLITFRIQVSKVLTLQQQLNIIIKDCSIESLDTLLKELNMVSNEIRFMFDSSNENRDKLENLFAEIMKDFKNKETTNLAEKQYQIIQITDSVISKQRRKIVELDNSEPII